MTISEAIEMSNELVSAMDELTQIPNDIRKEITTHLENVIDTLGEASDEYGDDPEEEDSEESPEEDY